MKLTVNIFLKALGFYLLLTSPTVFIPPLYSLSALYAITVGWLAWLTFHLAMYFSCILNMPSMIKWMLLFIAMAIGVIIGYQFIGLYFYDMKVWDDSEFIIFPIAAIMAGCISMFFNRKQINAHIN